MQNAPIRVGIGGWDYDPWRETFYPKGLPRAKQLEYAAGRLGAIEINSTFYRLQKPDTWRKWAEAVPKDFRFAIKASRISTNRRNLADGAETIGRFLAQGFTELGDKLGPILWQLPPTKKFDAAELGAFIALLPASLDGIRLRHALEVRHDSFKCREFVAMAQAANLAVACLDDDEYPQIADLTSDFAYARLRRTRDQERQGYPAGELDKWAAVARGWAAGERPDGLNYAAELPAPKVRREAFLFVIAGAKHRNPATAEALIERLGSR